MEDILFGKTAGRLTKIVVIAAAIYVASMVVISIIA